MTVAIDTVYLGWFLAYLLIVFGIGVWGWRRIDEHVDFATANRSLSLPFVWASLFATYVSALSVIGGVGYASKFGWAFMTLFMTGTVGGMGFLAISAKKWHRIEVNSISELMSVRYGSRFLRALTAIVVVFAFFVILVAQLFGIGFIVEGVIGVPMHWGILAVGLFFVGYTILGGMVSVARTDMLQVIIMGTGVLVIVAVLAWKLLNDPAHTFTENAELMTVYNGSTSTNLDLFAIFLVFGLGIAVHPYFVQRILSAKDVRTARLAPGLAALTAVIFYVALTIIGIIGVSYLPQEAGDPMAPAIIRELIGGTLGAVAMMAILAGVQSTTDSLLHVIGVYLSQDLFGLYYLEDSDQGDLLTWSRVFTGLFGIIGVSFAAYQAFAGQLTLLALLAAYAWGIIGGSLFVTVAAGLFWKRATKEGAIAAVVTGFAGAVVGHELATRGLLPFNEILLAVALSGLSMVVVSLVTARPGVDQLAPIFEDVRPDPPEAPSD